MTRLAGRLRAIERYRRLHPRPPTWNPVIVIERPTGGYRTAAYEPAALSPDGRGQQHVSAVLEQIHAVLDRRADPRYHFVDVAYLADGHVWMRTEPEVSDLGQVPCWCGEMHEEPPATYRADDNSEGNEAWNHKETLIAPLLFPSP
jgi:hypothetical protein